MVGGDLLICQFESEILTFGQNREGVPQIFDALIVSLFSYSGRQNPCTCTIPESHNINTFVTLPTCSFGHVSWAHY